MDIGRSGDEIDIPDGPLPAPSAGVDAPADGAPDRPADPSAAVTAGSSPAPQAPNPGLHGDPRTRLAGVIALYSLERLGLTAALAFALSYFMPVLVALAFAVVLQMPLAFVLFRGTRERLSAALAVTNARRRSDRDRLRAALAGEDDASDR